jgi:hypothetical protein
LIYAPYPPSLSLKYGWPLASRSIRFPFSPPQRLNAHLFAPSPPPPGLPDLCDCGYCSCNHLQTPHAAVAILTRVLQLTRPLPIVVQLFLPFSHAAGPLIPPDLLLTSCDSFPTSHPSDPLSVFAASNPTNTRAASARPVCSAQPRPFRRAKLTRPSTRLHSCIPLAILHNLTTNFRRASNQPRRLRQWRPQRQHR